jgi:hypothetical protein
MASKTGYVNSGQFCTIGDVGVTRAGTRLECIAVDGKRARMRMPAGETAKSKIRKRERRTPADRAADALRPSEVGHLRRLAGLPSDQAKMRRKSQLDKLRTAGFVDDQGDLTDAGRDALRRCGQLDDTTPKIDRSDNAVTDWSTFSVCPTCGADLTEPCHDLRDRGSLNATPHAGRPHQASDTLAEIDQRVAGKKAAEEYRLENHPAAYDLRNHPDRFVGKTVTVTSPSYGGTPGTTYTGELESAPYTPGMSHVVVRIKGVDGTVRLDPSAPVTVHDRSAQAGTDWSRFGICPACTAATGQPCHDLGSPGSLNATPHDGRPAILNRDNEAAADVRARDIAADKKLSDVLTQADEDGDLTNHDLDNACSLGLWHTGPCVPKDGPAPPADDEAKFQATRSRQADIDAGRAAAKTAAEVDELRAEGHDDVARQRLTDRIGHDHPNWTPDQVKNETDRIMNDPWADAAQHHTTPIGAAGGTEPYDPARHTAIGDAPTAGTPVTVVRPGAQWGSGDDTTPIEKAHVADTGRPVPARLDPSLPVEDRIRAAYDDLKNRKDSYVPVADLRAALPDVPNDQFDATLRRMSRADGDAYTVPESNQKALTEHRRAGALWMGNQDRHIVSFPGRDSEPTGALVQSPGQWDVLPADVAERVRELYGDQAMPSRAADTGSAMPQAGL